MIVYCGTSKWAQNVIYSFPGKHIIYKEDLTEELLDELKPEYIIFLCWNWLVPSTIVRKYFCVGFHASPLPKFRGGSPILNQLKRGIVDSKLSVFRMAEKFDDGPLLFQKALSLKGTMEEIHGRIQTLALELIPKVLAGNFVLHSQVGEPTYYWRKDAV